MPLNILLEKDCDGVDINVYYYCGNEVIDVYDHSNDCAIEYIISLADMVRLRDYLTAAIEYQKVIK